MTNERNALSQLFAACQKDAALKARFMNDPKAILADHGINVPEEMTVNVVQDSDTSMNITLPWSPPQVKELTDSELRHVSGADSLIAECETTSGPSVGGPCFRRYRSVGRRFCF